MIPASVASSRQAAARLVHDVGAAVPPADPARPPARYRLSVVIPCYNERDKLPSLLAELVRRIPPAEAVEIIVVDDGSKDGTREWLRSFAQDDLQNPFAARLTDDGNLVRTAADANSSTLVVRVHFHAKNGGKGAALRTGFAFARYEVVVIQDADLEYDPRDLGPMFALVARNTADVVFGSRFEGKNMRSLFRYHDDVLRPLYPHHYFANWLISRFVDVMCGSSLTDIEVCYKMFRREVLLGMTLTSNDFGIEVELTVKTLRARRWRFYETAIAYYPRTAAAGKKINWKDGFRALWYTVKFRFPLTSSSPRGRLFSRWSGLRH
jgi:glycosyltransferase involved in cell wall biosynthesis